MNTPIVIIETLEGVLQTLYSDSEILFIHVDKDEDDAITVTGPYTATFEKPDLRVTLHDLQIPDHMLSASTVAPFF